jgi:hypothetical protein
VRTEVRWTGGGNEIEIEGGRMTFMQRKTEEDPYQDKHHIGCFSFREELLMQNPIQQLPTSHQLHNHVHLESIIVYLESGSGL